MRTVLWSIVALLALFTFGTALAVAEDNGRAFGILAPPDWTPSDPDDVQPDVDVNAWYTNGTTGAIITEGVFIGPMAPGELRPIDATAFRGTGRVVCLNAYAERTGEPSTRVEAVPACEDFPGFPIVPPTLLAP